MINLIVGSGWSSPHIIREVPLQLLPQDEKTLTSFYSSDLPRAVMVDKNWS